MRNPVRRAAYGGVVLFVLGLMISGIATCGGSTGSYCEADAECADGVCCQDKNCDGGMCTYSCDDDLDCPDSMGCEHHYCFFLCSEDEDCDPGQRCEHDNTICEYEH